MWSRPSISGLRLNWHSGILPRAPAPDERTRFRPSCLPQLSNHTGARGFVQSSTVDDERRSLRQSFLGCVADRVIGMDANGVGCLSVRSVAIAISPRVDDHDFVA